MSEEIVSVSIGYYLFTEDQVNAYCDAQKKSTGHKHTWVCQRDARVEIFIELSKSVVDANTTYPAAEYTTFYLLNGDRIDYHESDVEKAKELAFGPNGKYKLRNLVRTMKGLDHSYHFDFRTKKWIRGSKV